MLTFSRGIVFVRYRGAFHTTRHYRLRSKNTKHSPWWWFDWSGWLTYLTWLTNTSSHHKPIAVFSFYRHLPAYFRNICFYGSAICWVSSETRLSYKFYPTLDDAVCCFRFIYLRVQAVLYSLFSFCILFPFTQSVFFCQNGCRARGACRFLVWFL